MQVAFLRCADDELGALSRRGKARRVLVFDKLLPALLCAVTDLRHRAQDRLPGLVRSKQLEPRLARQLDVHAQAVGQKAELLNKLRRRAGNGLGVDIAVEAVFVAQKRERTDHQLRCVIRRAQHAG